MKIVQGSLGRRMVAQARFPASPAVPVLAGPHDGDGRTGRHLAMRGLSSLPDATPVCGRRRLRPSARPRPVEPGTLVLPPAVQHAQGGRSADRLGLGKQSASGAASLCDAGMPECTEAVSVMSRSGRTSCSRAAAQRLVRKGRVRDELDKDHRPLTVLRNWKDIATSNGQGVAVALVGQQVDAVPETGGQCYRPAGSTGRCVPKRPAILSSGPVWVSMIRGPDCRSPGLPDVSGLAASKAPMRSLRHHRASRTAGAAA